MVPQCIERPRETIDKGELYCIIISIVVIEMESMAVRKQRIDDFIRIMRLKDGEYTIEKNGHRTSIVIHTPTVIFGGEVIDSLVRPYCIVPSIVIENGKTYVTF
jgi:hypothetical protein